MEVTKHQEPNTRLAGIGFVIFLNAPLIWGLINGLARKAIELLPGPIETKVIQEIHVRPNRLVAYKYVAGVMAAAQRLGVTNIGLVSPPQ